MQFASLEGVLSIPAVHLEVPKPSPPGHESIYEDDAGRKKPNPADKDASHHAVSCIVRYDGTWNIHKRSEPLLRMPCDLLLGTAT